MKEQRQAWEVVVFVISGVFLVCLLTSCGINHATQRVLTSEGARNQVGRVWAQLNPCAVDSVVRHVSDTTVMIDTIYVDTAYLLKSKGNTQSPMFDIVSAGTIGEPVWTAGPVNSVNIPKGKIPVIRKTTTIRDSTKIDKADLRAIDKLRGDSAYLAGQVRQWKDRAGEAKKEASKWLWAFIGDIALNALLIGLYVRSLITRIPKLAKPKI